LAAGLAFTGRVGRDGLVQIRERRQLRRAFGASVSPQIMEEILSGRFPVGLGGTRRRICVLFAGIRSFTTRSESMPPEAAIELLNRYLEEMATAIHAEGGTIDKFIGDGIMAFFGAPKPSAHPSQQGFHAARAMLARLGQLNQVLGTEGIEPVRIGIGLHVGEAVVVNPYDVEAVADAIRASLDMDPAERRARKAELGLPHWALGQTFTASRKPHQASSARDVAATAASDEDSVVVVRRIASRCPASAGNANGARISAAISQRQKFSVMGSNASRSARPVTQFPAQNRLESASSEKANARVPVAAPSVCW